MQWGLQLGLVLLVVQLYQEGMGNIPAVTLAVLGFNVYLYIFPAAPPIKACVSLQRVYRDKEWGRLFLSPLHHLDDLHLYYNMVSFLWKGIRLERRLGAAWFLYLLSVFFLLTGLVYLLLQAALTKLIEDSDPLVTFRDECAVGFSGVLFALKVVSNHYNPGGVTYVLNLRVSNRIASWMELVLIYLIAPWTSLVGHLAGILVGLLYTWGPLKFIMKKCAEFVSSDGNAPRPSSFFSSSGYSGTRQEYSEDPQHAEDHIADDRSEYAESYIAGLTEEEQIEIAIRKSLKDGGQTRQRRTEHPTEEEHTDHIPDDTSEYTESYVTGLSDEEQIKKLIRKSLNDGVRTRQRKTEDPTEEEVSREELRRRRLRRFRQDVSNQRRRRV
ncbi:rhomboid-related protein 4-like isoform X2 [Sebastes umbrosus]|nr:rhomboid-related protein 4-like isoform X2 [Sebastes umbrosus]XP_037632468.1 rhomboid-related protein 4-like isoform X2 [Sebastes umbrosus]XP_037632469.1 rhomboid-related protein 4-like isoform X2 [Sebastes umbrosus]XP_037632470.1 rhomboid-related protein 4-like isoform X2 [Sebastes umbrosus]XP_037632471.1 rhomboid-related protein 4-like isoform X2 [Sebastes umbrosus]XP_037632472.1 rhomboid-related protein 4-like isoform X2 [Sebastes umbrosus]